MSQPNELLRKDGSAEINGLQDTLSAKSAFSGPNENTLTDRYGVGVDGAGVRAEPMRFRHVPREVLEDGSVYPAHIVLEPSDLIVCYLETTYAAEQAAGEPGGLFDRQTEHGTKMLALLLAAPDLLAALKAILDSIEVNDDWAVSKALDAIAKATTPTGALP